MTNEFRTWTDPTARDQFLVAVGRALRFYRKRREPGLPDVVQGNASVGHESSVSARALVGIENGTAEASLEQLAQLSTRLQVPLARILYNAERLVVESPDPDLDALFAQFRQVQGRLRRIAANSGREATLP